MSFDFVTGFQDRYGIKSVPDGALSAMRNAAMALLMRRLFVDAQVSFLYTYCHYFINIFVYYRRVRTK